MKKLYYIAVFALAAIYMFTNPFGGLIFCWLADCHIRWTNEYYLAAQENDIKEFGVFLLILITLLIVPYLLGYLVRKFDTVERS